MKVIKMIKKIIVGILGIAFFSFALGMTILLLNYNEYGITQFGDKSLVLITDRIYSKNYNKGDLVIVEKRELEDNSFREVLEVGDEVFSFMVDGHQRVYIEVGKVGKIEIPEDKTKSYIAYENGKIFDIEFVIGEAVAVYPKIGGFLVLVESKWGFLFTVLVPCFLIFIYEVYSLIIEIKYGAEPDFFIDEPVKSEPEKKQTSKKNSTKKTTTTKKKTTKKETSK